MSTEDIPVVETSPEGEPVAEVWAYAGHRLTDVGSLVEEWFPKGGEAEVSLWYPKKPVRIIGGLYEVRVSRPPGRITLHGDPFWLGRYVDDEKRFSWSARHNATKVRHEKARYLANAAKADPLDEALGPLVAIVGKSRTRVEKDAVIATILRRLLDS